jgi:hypothetical protein
LVEKIIIYVVSREEELRTEAVSFKYLDVSSDRDGA